MTNDPIVTDAAKLRMAAEAGIKFPHYTNTGDPIDFPTIENKMDLTLHVIQLHDIARAVEQNIGKGQLSDDIRQCADRLNALIKKR